MLNLCNETITVFNARYDVESGKDIYVPTVIVGVSWFCEIASTVDEGLRAADKFTIRIPLDAKFGGKEYVEPVAWPEADPASAFTLLNGDIIVKGDASGVENPRPAVLQKLYPEMVTVLGVTDNRRAPNAKHWKVIGK